MATRRFLNYLFTAGGLYSSGPAPISLILYCAGDTKQDFWRDPICDSRFGGKSTVNVKFLNEEIDEDWFFKPQKLGEVDSERGKQEKPAKVLTIAPDGKTVKVVEEKPKESKRIARVLEISGNLSLALPDKQVEGDREIAQLGFASIMSQFFSPVMNLSQFDALEYRVRVKDNRKWIANVACDGDEDGEMYQAVFKGTEKWNSVIIPFKKYLYTDRGLIIEEQHDLDSKRINTLGFLQAERKEGEYCIQIESIRALSIARMSEDIRYDPFDSSLVEPVFNEEFHAKEGGFDYSKPPPKTYYSKVFPY